MDDRLPDILRRGARFRKPFTPEGYRELAEASLEDRRGQLLAELDRLTGRVDLTVPPLPEGAPPRNGKPLAPAPDARGGRVDVARGAWVAKYNPARADRDKHRAPQDRLVENSDVYNDFEWAQPGVAIGEPWIHSRLMRGAGARIPQMDIGDLVFPMRTDWRTHDGAWLRRRTIVGLWIVDSIATYPVVGPDGRLTESSEVACFPLRRFDFPVPIEATGDIDPAFDQVKAFHDRSRQALVGLSDHEALAVARACGLPAETLSEPDPIHLAAQLAGLDLGPPTVVRKRILDGARAHAFRSAVEKSARDHVVGQLIRARFGVVSTEKERGLGSDLWVGSEKPDGTVTRVRVEVKGLSGADPWAAKLTKSEFKAAEDNRGRSGWWLVIVTRAVRGDRTARWLTADDVVRTWTIETLEGDRRADRTAAASI